MEDFSVYVQRRTAALLRYAHVLTGDPTRAEDLVQGALAGAYRNWSSVADPDAYLRRSILHAYLNDRSRLLRRERVTASVPEAAVAQTGLEARLDLLQALTSLPPRQRAVVVLRYYEDMTEAQTAQVLGVAVGTVKSQHSKAMAALRSSDSVREETR